MTSPSNRSADRPATDHAGDPAIGSAIDHTPHATSRRWFASVAALGGMALLAQRSVAQPAQPAPGANGPRGPRSPEDMAKAIEARVERLVKAVDGTPEQKSKLVQLAQAALVDMQPLRAQHRQARQKGMALLAAATVDRAALEQLRSQQMGLADSLSKRMVQHMADAADVLSPAQRSKLAERMNSRMQSREGGPGGGAGGGPGGRSMWRGGHPEHGGGMGGSWWGGW